MIQSVILFLLYGKIGGYGVLFQPDSESYLAFDWSKPLSSVRTLGYPLFLSLLKFSRADISTVPYVQLLLYFLSVILLSFSLRAYGFSRIGAILAASPLFAKVFNGFIL